MISFLVAFVLENQNPNEGNVSIPSGTEIVGFMGESILGLRDSTLISINSDDSQKVIAEDVRSVRSLRAGSCIVYFKNSDKMILYNGLFYKFDRTWKTIAQEITGTFYCISSLENGQFAIQTFATLDSRPTSTTYLPEDFSDARFILGVYPDQIALAVDSQDQEFPELLIVKSNKMTRTLLARGSNSFSPQFQTPDGSIVGFLFPTPSNDLDPLFEGIDYQFGTSPTTPKNHPAIWHNHQKFATQLNLDANPDFVLLRTTFAFKDKYLIEAIEVDSGNNEQRPVYFYCSARSSKIMKLKIPSNSRLIDTNVQTGKLLFANDSIATIVQL